MRKLKIPSPGGQDQGLLDDGVSRVSPESRALNIREAEERAQFHITSKNICPEHPANVMGLAWARDFLALAALYREAVEALEAVHGTEPSVNWKDGKPYDYCPLCDDQAWPCAAVAVLAKARTALGETK